MSNVITNLGFWLIRTYYRLLKPNRLVKIILVDKVFKPGERIIASTKSRDLTYLGDDFYLIPKDMKT